MAALSQIYARVPQKFVRRVVREHMVHMNITTANLRKLLKVRDLDRDIKNRLYDILLYRRRSR